MKRNVVTFLAENPTSIQHDINEYVRVNNVHIVEVNYTMAFDVEDSKMVFSACVLFENLK